MLSTVLRTPPWETLNKDLVILKVFLNFKILPPIYYINHFHCRNSKIKINKFSFTHSNQPTLSSKLSLQSLSVSYFETQIVASTIYYFAISFFLHKTRHLRDFVATRFNFNLSYRILDPIDLLWII